MTKAVALDVISPFRPKWNQSRALDYLYYSGITNAKVRYIQHDMSLVHVSSFINCNCNVILNIFVLQQDRQIMRETYRQVTEQLEKHPQECERLEEECNIRLDERHNKTRNTRY